MTTGRIDRPPIFVAVDTVDLAHAAILVDRLAPHIGGVKLGLEFYCAHGRAGVERVMAAADPVPSPPLPLFLDLKLHDIPNTVAGAARAIAPLRPAMVTVHAAGGPAMLKAVRGAMEDSLGERRPRVLAVTVLTSLDDGDLARIGQAGPVRDQVVRLAAMSQANGADGVICAAPEVVALRSACGPDFLLVVPGIRPTPAAGDKAAPDDQKRTMTPAEALTAGADLLVIGRPITADRDPVAAANRIAAACRTVKGRAGAVGA